MASAAVATVDEFVEPLLLDELPRRRQAHLVEHQIPLEVCPTSNVLTGAAPSYEGHPVRAFFLSECRWSYFMTIIFFTTALPSTSRRYR